MSEGSAHHADHGTASAVAPPTEPKTPMWLPALGGAIFVAIGLWWATSPPRAQAPAVAESASASAAAAPGAPPAAAPTPPPPPQVASARQPQFDAGGNQALQQLMEKFKQRPH